MPVLLFRVQGVITRQLVSSVLQIHRFSGFADFAGESGKLQFLFSVEDGEQALQVGGMSGIGFFNASSACAGKCDDDHSLVIRIALSGDIAILFRSIDSGGDRAAGQHHGLSDSVHGLRAFGFKVLENGEIRNAPKTQFPDAPLVEGLNGLAGFVVDEE